MTQITAMVPTPLKRVRFSYTNAVLEIEAAAPALNDEHNRFWYSSTDLAAFQETARRVCRDQRRRSRSKRNKYSHGNLVHTSSGNIFHDTGGDFQLNDDQTIRGLEVIAHPRLGRQRMTQRMRAIRSVLIAQDTARHHTDGAHDFDKEIFIAFFAAKESLEAKRFAALMGKTDESAVLPRSAFQAAIVSV